MNTNDGWFDEDLIVAVMSYAVIKEHRIVSADLCILSLCLLFQT